MEVAEIVDPALQTARDRVLFGATVTYRDENDKERTVRIIGIDEARIENGEVSWVSPVARALLNGRRGDAVEMRTPGGEVEIEIIDISYDSG